MYHHPGGAWRAGPGSPVDRRGKYSRISAIDDTYSEFVLGTSRSGHNAVYVDSVLHFSQNGHQIVGNIISLALDTRDGTKIVAEREQREHLAEKLVPSPRMSQEKNIFRLPSHNTYSRM